MFLLLVGATFSAFFVAQRLKSAPAVVTVGRLTQYFSPNGDGRRDRNEISVRVTEADDVTLSVVDGDGDEVRRLLTAAPAEPYRPLRATWDGSTDAGSRAPDGTYRVRIRLHRQGRSVDVQRAIRLDTTPPRPRILGIEPPVTGPEPGEIRFSLRGASRFQGSRFRVLRTDGARPVEVARFARKGGRKRIRWSAWPPDTAPGTYMVVAEVRDRAGNAGTAPAILPPQPGSVTGKPGVTVRTLAVAPPLTPIRGGGRARFLVDARRQPYRWSIRRLGQSRIVDRGRERRGEPRLTIRVPEARSGVYLMQVTAGEASTRVPFLVQSQRRAPILVVLPAITWLGTDRVDDDGDGLPNSLDAGTPVAHPRVLTRGDGLPAGFADEIAPLLAFLDRARLPYDLTTDLALATAGTDPRPTDRPGVLLPGTLRWVPEDLARRLRRYVSGGGRLAHFGVGTLRRGVTVARARLLRPTQPAPVDPFGARLAPVRRLERETPTLEPLAEAEGVGLLTGVSGTLRGFSLVEESLPRPRGRGRDVVALGASLTPAALAEAEAAGEVPPEPRPALTGTRLGRGLVIRVGLPEWPERLEDPAVAQITRNVADLLRGVRPRLRSTR